jgi:hypothetical protein
VEFIYISKNKISKDFLSEKKETNKNAHPRKAMYYDYDDDSDADDEPENEGIDTPFLYVLLRLRLSSGYDLGGAVLVNFLEKIHLLS